MNSILIWKPETTLDDAIKALDSGGNGFLTIVDETGKLRGIITDGDLRRGFLKRAQSIADVINSNPIIASNQESHVEIKKRLKTLKRRHMPVVDEKGILVEVVNLDEFVVERRENWVVIMAGGMGTRLGELTKDTPKPMLRVGGKPMLHRIIDNFKSQGFFNFVICVNYKSHVIEDYFGDGSSFGVIIEYTRETQRMGTAGALSLLQIPIDHPLIVVNGDIVTDVNFVEFINFHEAKRAAATMCVKHYRYDIPYACVQFDEHSSMTGILEKPAYNYYINTGMYVLDKACLSKIPEQTFYDMPTLFQQLIDDGLVVKVFAVDDYWLDIGLKEDFIKANAGRI